MVSQNAIPSKQHLGGYLPYAFTEQGVASLSSVLTSDRAIEVNLLIMRAFVSMRRFLSANADIFRRLDNIEHKQLETDMTEAIRKHRDMKSILEDIRNNIFVYEDIIKTNEDN
jgi:hypothetical protein